MTYTTKILRLVLTTLITLIPLILLIVYASKYASLIWESKQLVHGLFMLSSMLIVLGFSVTAWKNIPIKNRLARKAMHVGGHTLSLVLLFIGWWQIYSAEDEHYLTVHGWIGLLTMVVFVITYIVSAGIFNPVIKGGPVDFKPYHITFGFSVVLLSAAATLTGLLNYQESYMPAIYQELVKQTRHTALYCGEATGALETKFERVEPSGPLLVHLDQTELLGRTRDGTSPDVRVIQAVRGLMDRLRGADRVWVVGSCTQQNQVLMPIKHLFDCVFFLPPPTSQSLTKFLARHVSFQGCEAMVENRLKHQTFRQTLNFLSKIRRHLGHGLNANERVTPEILERILPAPLSSARETHWEDIGGVGHVRKEVEDTIEMPLKCPELAHLRRAGLLLFGEPGCGKTMVARAIATQCNLTFHSVQGPELLNSYVGQSEGNVRAVFEEARKTAPSVIFFDEIDAIAPRRSGGVIDRVLAQLLSEMDSSHSETVFVVAATNRAELLDPAIMRPGRLDKHIEVTVGRDVSSRVEVFSALARKLELDPGVCFKTVSEMTGPLSGAECYGVLLEAAYTAIERCVGSGEKRVVVRQNDLISVITNR
eukprot:sb/3463260/